MELLYVATLLLAALLSDGSVPVLASESAGGHSFSYEGANGPEYWPDEYQTCAGKFQSPIDIEEHLVTYVCFPPLKFHNFDKEPESTTLTNNGHTVMLQYETTEKPYITGGPLKGKYVFQQLHYHWGSNDSLGSEDTINNQSFPLEAHIVFYKAEYGNFDNATHHRDGLAVFAVFVRIYGGDNPKFTVLTSALSQVTQPETEVHLKTAIKLITFLPQTTHLYFTYNGSLTTPPCLEVVTWIEFKQPILLSAEQVNAFRGLRTEGGELTHNFRPVQALGDRPVYFNKADDNNFELCVHNSAVSSFVTSFILGIFLVLMLVVLQQ